MAFLVVFFRSCSVVNFIVAQLTTLSNLTLVKHVLPLNSMNSFNLSNSFLKYIKTNFYGYAHHILDYVDSPWAFYLCILTQSCLCVVSDKTPGDAAKRGAKKGTVMQLLA